MYFWCNVEIDSQWLNCVFSTRNLALHTLYSETARGLFMPQSSCDCTTPRIISKMNILLNYHHVTNLLHPTSFSFLETPPNPQPFSNNNNNKKTQPLQIVTYRLLSLCLLSRGAKAGKGSRGEAFSNNDQPADLYTVTLSFHTLPKAVTMVGVEEVGPRGSSRQGRECHM